MEIAVNSQARYGWHHADLSQVTYLQRFKSIFSNDISLYCPENAKPLQRKNQNGIWLFTGTLFGQKVAVCWNDFRISGGSFGKENVDRMLAFLSQTKQQRLPLILGVNSMGVKISQGRTLFDKAFSLIPAIESYRQSARVFAISAGNCFGLGAILFGLADYRLAIRETAKINLTGPEVFSLFFGKAIDFDELTCADNQNKKTSLISEIVLDLNGALNKIANLILFERGKTDSVVPELYRSNCDLGLPQTVASPESHKSAYDFLTTSCDGFIRLFRTMDDKLLVFAAHINGRRFGVVINPPGNSDNMIGERTLELYKQALTYFRSLEIPLLSVLDTPGADPRVTVNNYRILERIIEVGRLIYDYPYKKMGIGYGRCFGGACILAIPRIFGGSAAYTIQGTELGIMHPDIITQLLSGSGRLLSEWKENEERQTADLKDMINEGSVDGVISVNQVRQVILQHLFDSETNTDKAITDAGHKYLPKISPRPPREKQGGRLA